MKNLQNIGIGLFIIGVLIFISGIFIGGFDVTDDILKANLKPKQYELLGEHYNKVIVGKEFSAGFSLSSAFETEKFKEVNENFKVAQDWDNYVNDPSAFTVSIIKASTQNPFSQNPWVMFLLTFGLGILGSLLYILPQFITLGGAGIKNDHIFQHAATNRGWIAWAAFVFLVGFYVLLYFFPQFITNWTLILDPMSMALSGNAASQWFLYGFLYCTVMMVMAIRMFIKYRHNKYQIIRTASVLFFQIAFAFLIPEILVRFNHPYMDFKNAWPLDYDFFFDWNIQSLVAHGTLGVFMLFWGVILTLIIIPVLVYIYGKRWYCSWVCGCGGLAETLGDPYRQLSDKSIKAWKFERWIIHLVMVFAAVMTIANLYLFFHNNPEGYYMTKLHFVGIVAILSITGIVLFNLRKGEFAKMSKNIRWAGSGISALILCLCVLAYFTGNSNVFFLDGYSLRSTYGFMIGSIFSGVIGTGFYPIFGNRTWCRFGCPLAGYMGLVQRFKSRFRITANGSQCISCGNCSTYCEQGIDVRWYAQRGQNIVRSSCVGCGVCAAVCPRGVLKLENGPEEGRINDNPILIGKDSISIVKD